MSNSCDIRFLCDIAAHMELVSCSQSTLSYPLHNHVSVFTIGMVLEGAVALVTNDGSRLYKEGGIFAVPPYMPHSIQAQERYTLLSLCMKKDKLDREGLDAVKACAAGLLKQAPGREKVSCGQMIGLLSCLTSFCESQTEERESFIDGLRKQLELFPEIPLSLDEMAEAVYISKYHFIRSFKQEIGLTPHQFQIQNRIRKAQRLLSQTGTIAEVALAVGFYDQSHFVKQFEKIVGLTPAGYRRSCEVIGISAG